MKELAKYMLRSGKVSPCKRYSDMTELAKYTLKEGKISPCGKYSTNTSIGNYTLWKKINKRSEITGAVIFSQYEAFKINQCLEDWENKKIYNGKKVRIY